jgi:hypothetical protein
MTSRRQFHVHLAALAVAGSLLAAGPALAQSAPIANPDVRLQSYYRENAAEITRLQGIVENATADEDQRKKALGELAFKFEDAALPLAAKLVNDPAPGLASDAVNLLSNSVVMANHDDHAGNHPPDTTLSPWSKYVAAQHELARDALRNGLADPRPDIRATSLRALLTLSDEVALKSVQESARKGELTDAEAVRLCAQAVSNPGRSCVFGYLSEGSPDAKVAAIDVLGSIPTYRPLVRNKIFFNTNADPKTRSAAADVLSRYDPSFMNYALTVTADPKTPPEVYTSALEGFARSASSQGKLDSVQRNAIDTAVTNYKVLLLADPQKNEKYLKSLDATVKAVGQMQ